MARGNNKRQASIRTNEDTLIQGPFSTKNAAQFAAVDKELSGKGKPDRFATKRIQQEKELADSLKPLEARYNALEKRVREGDPAEEARYRAAQKRHNETWDAVEKFPADSPERKEWEEKEHRPYVDELRRHTSLEASIRERKSEVYREMTAIKYKLRKLRERMKEAGQKTLED